MMIEDFKLHPLTNPEYIHTHLATYKQDGVAKDWEVLDASDSVAILIYHTEHDSFVLVRQFRPAVYLKNNNGITVELCAGIVDKDIPLEQIAREEILEECGFDIPVEKIDKITSFYTSVGFAGSRQTLYCAQVDESMRISEGGGIDDEQIEVIELPVSDIRKFIFDESIAKTAGLMFAFFWWKEQKA